MYPEELRSRNRDGVDILMISGDAYVDHPSFGTALLARHLEAHGYSVAIVAQPRWNSLDDITRFGRPRLFCGITAGAMDSMVANYTAFRKKRRDDAYTPGGRSGARPNRAALVYTGLARQAFPGLPIVLGGIEASLRRAAHYDFWDDKLRRSILFDSKADILVYGMGERAILEIARRLEDGKDLEEIHGTCRIADAVPPAAEEIPGYEEILASPRELMTATLQIEQQVHRADRILVQRHDRRLLLIQPPAAPLSREELDALYELPFQRRPHPAYREPIPAAEMIAGSITAIRGCAGGCTFCSLALHQGRRLRSRSRESIIREVIRLSRSPGWNGTISDVGGPTANLWGSQCRADPGACRRASCLYPSRCPQLQLAQDEYLALLREIRSIEGVRSIRVGSGIRFDLLDENPRFRDALIEEFVGGQLKVAPEHTVPGVLRLMRKTDFSLFERFCNLFSEKSRITGHRQYIIPYVMSAFPGCRMEDMHALKHWFAQRGWEPRQVQCFIPTPGTVATAMFYAECDTSGQPIFVARSDRQREDQHRILVQKGVPEPARQKKRPSSRRTTGPSPRT